MAKKLPLKVNSVCKWFGISKSGFYKKKQNLAKVEAFENLVCQRIRGLRKLGLMCGLKSLQEEFDIKIGRECFWWERLYRKSYLLRHRDGR